MKEENNSSKSNLRLFLAFKGPIRTLPLDKNTIKVQPSLNQANQTKWAKHVRKLAALIGYCTLGLLYNIEQLRYLTIPSVYGSYTKLDNEIQST